MEKLENGLSRRDFLKISALAGGVVGAVSLFPGETEKAEAKTYDSVDDMIDIDPQVFERFDACNTAFLRCLAYSPEVDTTFASYPVPHPLGLLEPDANDDPDLIAKVSGENTDLAYELGDPGFTQIDKAFQHGGESMYVAGGGILSGMGLSWDSVRNMETEDGALVPMTMFGQSTMNFSSSLSPVFFDVNPEKFEFDSLDQASYAIKKAAKVYGADLVGIAPYDERFVFGTEPYIPLDVTGTPIEDKIDMHRPLDMGFEPKSVIVLAFEMDYQAMKTAGGFAAEGAVMTAYSRMMEVGVRLATFIRGLGYNTYHCGNNASPSVAEAIRAGLGEGGRSSILITEEYGPRVRLAKIYTDLEFTYDKPKSFGVTEFCEVCQVCADTCPSQAITHLSIDDPENKPKNISAQAGMRKYYLDAQKCLYHWKNIDSGCGICIAVCPYNKPQTWNHELVKIVTRIPGLNSLARYFDEFFGYGGVPDDQQLYDFWRKEI